MSKTVTIDTLAEIYRSPEVMLVDCRPTAAYNGWRLCNEARGGHIPGARAFPQSWAVRSYDAVLMEKLASKGLTPNRLIVVYGYDDEDSSSLADRLAGLGFDDLVVFTGGLPEWADQEQLEMARLPRFGQLVHPHWLHRLLEEPKLTNGSEDPVLFHVNWDVPEEYGSGHIPGAFYLDTQLLESPTDWNRRSPDELESALLRLEGC